ncbi:amidohydrolase [Myxococcota bacterium]|nr:amidohydrolase [Myxococcota bacterium]
MAVGANLALLACAKSPKQIPEGPADVVFLGDHIYTVDESTAGASAVAVRGTEIVAVGGRKDVEPLMGDSTRVVNLGHRALVPGFIDAHGHLGMTAQMLDLLNASSPPVGPMTSVEDIVGGLKSRIRDEQIPVGEFVMGYGYDDSLLAEGRHPNRDDLDRASSEHPILLLHVSGHLATVNSEALAMLGYDETTEDPYGGVIRRRPGTRIPNGVLEETAVHGALAPMFESSGDSDPRAFADRIRRAIEYNASYGVTTIQDGASNPTLVQGLRAIARHEPLAVDVALFPAVQGVGESLSLESIGYSPVYTDGVRVAGVKFVLDGSPQGRTAWLTRPYDEGPPGAPANYVAYSMVEPEAYKKQVKKMLDAGIPVLVHANGDAAIDLMIEGVEEGLDGETRDHRSVTIHAQLAREDQLDAMKRLGIVPSFFAAHPFFWGDWHRLSFGDDRAMGISPLRSAEKRDLAFTIHNDAPVVPPDVMLLMEIAIGRKTRAGVVLGADQRIDFDEALYAVTLGSAYQYFEEDRKGSIRVGKQADLVVLERDPKSVPVDELSEIAVVETMARGETVFSAP